MAEIIESFLVPPSQETPKQTLFLSNLDLATPNVHVTLVYLYRNNGEQDFFSVEVMKASLAKTLVPFYPVAGRVVPAKNGRMEIECTGEGALFVVARSQSNLSEYEDFVPSEKIKKSFLPTLEPDGPCHPALFQVTFFKCGGVCLGTAMHHSVVDARTGFNFMKTWATNARGLEASITPLVDRTILRARSPPTVLFNHDEYESIKASPSQCETTVLKISKEQVEFLKGSKYETKPPLTTFLAVSTYVWKCTCLARGLSNDQETRFFSPIEVRARVEPPISNEYLGNAVVMTSTKAKVEDIVSKPLEFGAKKISAAFKRIDNEYVRSMIDYLEVQGNLFGIAPKLQRTDVGLVSWLRMSMDDANFKWGDPILISRSHIYCCGFGYIGSNGKDGEISVALGLEPETMPRFKEIFHEGLKKL